MEQQQHSGCCSRIINRYPYICKRWYCNDHVPLWRRYLYYYISYSRQLAKSDLRPVYDMYGHEHRSVHDTLRQRGCLDKQHHIGSNDRYGYRYLQRSITGYDYYYMDQPMGLLCYAHTDSGCVTCSYHRYLIPVRRRYIYVSE